MFVVLELLMLMANESAVNDNETWFVEWEKRERQKTEDQEKKNKQFWKACRNGNWENAMQLLNDGATNDFIDEYTGVTAMLFILAENKMSLHMYLTRNFIQEERRVATSIVDC